VASVLICAGRPSVGAPAPSSFAIEEVVVLMGRSILRLIGMAATAAACALVTSGCGESGGAKNGAVYSSPEEVSQKKAAMQDAMKGGAYGSAGRKAAATSGGS